MKDGITITRAELHAFEREIINLRDAVQREHNLMRKIKEMIAGVKSESFDEASKAHESSGVVLTRIDKLFLANNSKLGRVICEECNREISDQNIRGYQEEGGEGNPAVCSDCAELAAR